MIQTKTTIMQNDSCSDEPSRGSRSISTSWFSNLSLVLAPIEFCYLCYQKDTKEIIVCDFWSLVIKGITGSALLFLGSLALAEASCMWWRHSSSPIEGSCREKLRPPVNGRHGPASPMKRPVHASRPDPVKPTSWLWHHGDPGTEAP